MYAGVDLGATNLRAVVADGEETVRGRDRRPTPRGPDGAAVTDAVLATLRAACDAAGVRPDALSGVGVAAVGPLDREAGAAVAPANLPDAVERVALVEPVEDLAGGPVLLHNDATAGVIGERFHARDAPEDLVYLTISSGIGAGVCVDGHVLSGWDGNAGEVGHVTVDPAGAMRCGCGGRGHWEAYCSGENLPRYARHLHDGERTALALDGSADAADVFARAGADAFADRVLARVAEWNAVGVATLVQAYAPRVVAVGGSVALEHPGHVLDPVRERLPDLVTTGVPDLRPTTLGEDAVVRGARASALTGGSGRR